MRSVAKSLMVAEEDVTRLQLMAVGQGLALRWDGCRWRQVPTGVTENLWDIWAHHLNQKGLPGRLMVRVLSPFWRLRAGVPWKTLEPARRVGEVGVPFLVLHGQEDESVPVSHAHLLARAGGVEPQVFPGQGHTDLLDSPEVIRIVVDFLERCPA